MDKTTFNGEKLSMISTIQRGKDGNYTEKTSNVVIKIFKGDKARSVGMITLNLSHYIDAAASSKVKFAIEKCPDKNAYLEIAVHSTLLNAVTGSDTMSMMSGFDNYDSMSIEDGPNSEFDFKELEKDTKEEEKNLDQVNIGIK